MSRTSADGRREERAPVANAGRLNCRGLGEGLAVPIPRVLCDHFLCSAGSWFITAAGYPNMASQAPGPRVHAASMTIAIGQKFSAHSTEDV